VWWPVSDDGIGVPLDPWPSSDAIYTDPDIYFEASALLKGEQKLVLQSADNELAVVPKIFSFSSLSLRHLTPSNAT
jgi:hypothetical protein